MTEPDFDTPSEPSAAEVADAFRQFMRNFTEYKHVNDERLAQIEARSSADIVTTEKIERVEAALDAQKSLIDQLAHRQQRPPLGAARPDLAAGERKAAFRAWMRGGDEALLRPAEAKTMSWSSPADGAVLVPEELSAEIGRRLSQLSPIRSIASVRQVSGPVLKKPFAISGPAVGWVAETEARPETATPAISELEFPTMEQYAMPAATATLLEDAAIDLDQWLTSEIEIAFAEQEGKAFVHGDGDKRPKGFLSYPTTWEAEWAWGKIGYELTGKAGSLPEEDPSDVLIHTIYSLKSGYRQNAAWVMNRKTQSAIRRLKDADGNYLWQPPAAVGQPAMLMGFRVVEAEDMPDPAADSLSVAFGDFARGYLVVDRTGIRILRDPYSAKPYVLFYTTRRVGGGVQDFDAIKLVKFGVA